MGIDREFRREIRPEQPIDLRLTLGPLRRGSLDPSMVIDSSTGVWRASRTPDGPVTLHLRAEPSAARIVARAWGPGARWALDHAPSLCGADDDPSAFAPTDPLVHDLHRRMPGLRIPRSLAVMEALVPSILEQKVTGLEARRSYRRLVRRYGEAAPGPAGREPLGLRVPPSAERLAGLPSYAFHPLGVERKRADTIRRVCAAAGRLEETTAMAPGDAGRRLTSVPGVGPWTAAEVATVALGDTDAVSVGDYHLPHTVAWALAGEPRADDARMLELLEPYRGHRARAVRLIEASGIRAPRYGPRLAPRAHL